MDYAERAGLRTHCQWQPQASSPLPPSAVPPTGLAAAPATLAPALRGHCRGLRQSPSRKLSLAVRPHHANAGVRVGRWLPFQARAWLMGHAPGPVPAGPGAAARVLRWKASSALLKRRTLAALHAEWRRAACSRSVVWLPVPVDRRVCHRNDRGHLRAAMCACAANPQTGACSLRAGAQRLLCGMPNGVSRRAVCGCSFACIARPRLLRNFHAIVRNMLSTAGMLLLIAQGSGLAQRAVAADTGAANTPPFRFVFDGQRSFVSIIVTCGSRRKRHGNRHGHAVRRKHAGRRPAA
jgi:hypothetical protein